MYKFVTEVATYLQASGIGTVGVDIFKNMLPSSPVVCVAVIVTGGSAGIVSPNVTEVNYQVLVRGTVISSVAKKAADVYTALDDQWNVLSSVRGYHRPQHPVGAHYFSDENYPIYPLNFVFRGVGSKLGL